MGIADRLRSVGQRRPPLPPLSTLTGFAFAICLVLSDGFIHVPEESPGPDTPNMIVSRHFCPLAKHGSFLLLRHCPSHPPDPAI